LFLLALSHDEFVHGKATVIQKMWGDYEDKFRQCRALYLYMMTHPGKKLNFMGNEIAQFREWDERRQQDWELLKFPMHDGFYHYVRTLNELYYRENILYEKEYDRERFRWLVDDAKEQSVYVYEWEREKDACGSL
ncbi:MAG: 1,4-alpha-glucan branching enzyme, partial [[Clostridium] nexile]